MFAKQKQKSKFPISLQVSTDQLHFRHQRPAVREGPVGTCPIPEDARRIRPDRNAAQRRRSPVGPRTRTATRAAAAVGHDLLQVARRRAERGRGRGGGTETSVDRGNLSSS